MFSDFFVRDRTLSAALRSLRAESVKGTLGKGDGTQGLGREAL